jgi:ABC-type transport system substrate-binding protein
VRRGLGAAAWLAVATAAAAALGPRYGGEAAVAVVDLPASLDPASPRSAGARTALGLVHETLLALGPDGLPRPSLASGWTSAADGLAWTLRLQPGASFHDARPVTAEDAVRSLRRFLRAPSAAAERLATSLDGGPAFRAGSSQRLEGLARAGELELVLRLAFPGALPLAPLASPAAAVTSVSGAGAGPFVPASAPAAGRLSATAFGGHARGRPFLDRVQLVVVPDPRAAANELLARRLDVAPGEGDAAALAATLLLALDDARPPFDRLEARRALAEVARGAALVRDLVPGADPTPALLAPSLLPRLGGPAPEGGPAPRVEGRVALTVACEVPPLVSQRLVALLRTVGLELIPSVVGAPDAVAAGGARLLVWCPEVAEAGVALEELASLVPSSRSLKETLEAAAREADPDRRRVLLLQAEQALREEARLVPLGALPVAYAARPGLHGLAVNASGRLVLEDAWLEP